ncbi:MAG TPA: hypothetical protein VFG63_04565 [Nocardioidaceae bacterium]|nr:hypothetical protein [Nocardioidaceae bacterium]
MRNLLHQHLDASSLARAGKAAVVGVLGSFAYIAGWQLLGIAGFSLLPLLVTVVACVLVGTAVMGVGMRFAGIRRPLVGGGYVAVLLVVYGAFLAYTEGYQLLTWPAWPAIAAYLGVIYALQQGGPRYEVPCHEDQSAA